ncbi:Energy-dependent translational throttle protein EttA [bacterium HR26]|nr:Energy-dependent translational throttle protein EttA [bacterium HR26]
MPTTILSVENLSKRFGAEEIFSGITFQIQERDRIGLVGVNGAGKSTLLRILAGLEQPDGGALIAQRGLRIGYLAQEAAVDPSRTVLDAALEAMEEVRQLGRDLERLTTAIADASGEALDRLLAEYAQKTLRFEAAGGYDLEHRAAEVLAGLGFEQDEFSRPAGQLSGGQRTRLALARALLADPDLLLLDEPTNHLDLQALTWLEDFLRAWRGAFVVVSHDRYFLDQVTERTLELSFGHLEDYPGNYSRYLELRAERLARRWAEYEAQQEFIRKEEEFIRRYRAGQRAREARGRATRLARLERIERPREHEALRLQLTTGLRSGRIVLTTSELVIGYPASDGSEPVVLCRTPELVVERGERVAIIGPNGAGKTTLIRTLLGEHSPLSGQIRYGTAVRPAYYAQGHEQLDPKLTVLGTIMRRQPMSEEAARTLAGRFLFSGDDVVKPVSALSGGERSRLALALLTLERGNLLILDEPTNHLDIASREALESVLEDFEGTILFVSHDRYLIDRLATRVWSIEDGVLQVAPGNYTDYQRLRATTQDATARVRPTAGTSDGRARPSEEMPKPARRSPRQVERELRAAEERIGELEERLNALADDLAEATARQDIEAIAELGAAYEAIQEELDAAYRHWEALQEELDAVTGGVER